MSHQNPSVTFCNPGSSSPIHYRTTCLATNKQTDKRRYNRTPTSVRRLLTPLHQRLLSVVVCVCIRRLCERFARRCCPDELCERLQCKATSCMDLVMDLPYLTQMLPTVHLEEFLSRIFVEFWQSVISQSRLWSIGENRLNIAMPYSAHWSVIASHGQWTTNYPKREVRVTLHCCPCILWPQMALYEQDKTASL